MKNPRKPRNLSKEGRARVTVWLERKLIERIRFDAKERFVTQQSIIESAIRDAYRPPAEDLEAFIARRFNYVDTALKKLDSQSQVATEAFALFFRLWLIATPRIIGNSNASPEIQDFHRKCLKIISKKIDGGQTILSDVEAVRNDKGS